MLDSRYTLNVEYTKCPVELDMGCERKEGIKYACNDFCLRNWRSGIAIKKTVDRVVEYQDIFWGVHSVVMADGEYST